MSRRPDETKDTNKDTRTPATARSDRLKAALKSNIARRKAQARARDDGSRGDREQ